MKKVPHGILFGNKHSWNDWRLVPLTRPVFAPPEPVRILQEVPGRNGAVDLSKSLSGFMNYKNRLGTFEFQVESKANWQSVYSEIMNSVHGKKMRVVLDDDPLFYYDGFVTVNEWKSEEMASTIVIQVDAFPYKLKNTVTTVNRTVSGQQNITCKNLSMPVVPEITNDAQFTLTFDDRSVTLQAGTHKVPELVLTEGDNIIKCVGTGKISFKYQEGEF